jgi:hypothetical protein
MAYPPTRSCNGELFEGMTDGSYKKEVPAVSRMFADPANLARYQGLDTEFYGRLRENPDHRLPDGRTIPASSRTVRATK